MKIRTGFVSNSSSSSFVVLGYAVPRGFMEEAEVARRMELVGEDVLKDKDEEDQEDILRETLMDDSDIFYDTETYGKLRDKVIIGIKLANISSEDGMKEQDLDFEQISADAKELKEKLEIDPNIPLKLYTGTRQC